MIVFISLSAFWWRMIKGLWKLTCGRDWLRGQLGLVLIGGAILSKSLIQFSLDGWSCVPTLLFEVKKWSEVIQSSLVQLCYPMDCSLPDSSVHGILQARILEWVAISFSRGSSQPRDRTQVSWISGRHFTIWATRRVFLPCYLPGAKLWWRQWRWWWPPSKDLCMYCYTQCPQPWSRPPPTHASARNSQTPTGKSRTVSCVVTAPFFWALVHRVLLSPPRVYFPVPCKF